MNMNRLTAEHQHKYIRDLEAENARLRAQVARLQEGIRAADSWRIAYDSNEKPKTDDELAESYADPGDLDPLEADDA